MAENPTIRPFPTVVNRLLLALQNPNSTPDTFAEIIECDAGLAARLLKMTNSPLYGLRHTIQSIGHACSMLGRRPLKTLALSLAAASMFNDDRPGRDERAVLWRHSLGCATTARLLARHTSLSPDSAFLAGIFHDIGKLVFYDVVPKDYARIARFKVGRALAEEELKEFAISHGQIGLRSAHAWNMAEEVKVAIGYLHFPENAPNHSQFVLLVSLADAVSRNWGIGSTQMTHLDLSKAMRSLKLNEAILPGLVEEARTIYQETVRACA